ncbi:MAG TPA: hypothetical protein VGP46_03525 [Acidimicrobiales bacterium]|nr:hypothetical protein [Acidimicrobiales bacterium]
MVFFDYLEAPVAQQSADHLSPDYRSTGNLAVATFALRTQNLRVGVNDYGGAVPVAVLGQAHRRHFGQRSGQPLLDRCEQARLRIRCFLIGDVVQQVHKGGAVVFSQLAGDLEHSFRRRSQVEVGSSLVFTRLFHGDFTQASGQPHAAGDAHLLGQGGRFRLVADRHHTRKRPYLVEGQPACLQRSAHHRQG